MLARFEENPRFGLVGTPFIDESTYDYRFVSIEHVSGACQLFRRECFEDIGGYVPMKLGGVDHVAVITARMRGWKTRTFPEKHCVHHRKMGSALYGRIRAIYRIGVLDYALGGHPLWEVFRARTRRRSGLGSFGAWCSTPATCLRPHAGSSDRFPRNSSPLGGGNRWGASAPSPSIGFAARRPSPFRSAVRPEEDRPTEGIASRSGGPVQ